MTRVSPLRKALEAYFAKHKSTLLSESSTKVLHEILDKPAAVRTIASATAEREMPNGRESLRTHSEAETAGRVGRVREKTYSDAAGGYGR